MLCLLTVEIYIMMASLTLILTLTGTQGASEKELYEELFSDYSSLVRPRRNAADVVQVGVEFELTKIDRLEWRDDYLQWNESLWPGINSLVVPPKYVWLPDICIANSAGSTYQSTFSTDFRLLVRASGQVTWSFGGQLELLCATDLTYYPFDHQTCDLVIENWAYDGNKVDLVNVTENITMSDYQTNGVWNISRTSVHRKDIFVDFDPGVPYPRLIFTMLMRRKISYYAINLMVPNMLILSIALALFWLPAASGEKVSLGITVMLAFSVYQLLIIDSIPENSDYIPVLSLVVIFVMGVSTFSTLVSILVVFFEHRVNDAPVPACVRKFFFNILARALCMSQSVPRDELGACAGQSDAEPPSAATVPDEEKNKLASEIPSSNEFLQLYNNVRFLNERTREQERSERHLEQWRALGRVVDRLAFWVVFITVVAFLGTTFTAKDPSH